MSDNEMPMAWNEPGSGDKNQNPWGKKSKDTNGPPDLDEVFKNFQRRIKGLFGKKNTGGPAGSNQPFNSSNLKIFVSIALGLVLALYLLFGFYTIASYEQGVITRFGKYYRTVTSGLHWIPRFVDNVQKVNTENIKSSRHSGWMLTKDENIILVEMEVQYRIIDAEKYLFNVATPDLVLTEAGDSALRQVIGDSFTDDVLTNKKQQIAEAIKDLLVEILSRYDAGFHIEAVNFRDSRPPDDVKDAFDDVTKSREDRERLKLQAEAYSNTMVPEAEGAATRIIAEAEAYKEKVILDATGEAQRFNLILPGYQRSPQVTRTRMYLEAMQEVLTKTTTVIVSSNSGNNMIYVPLDKLMDRNGRTDTVVPYKVEPQDKANVQVSTNQKERSQ